MISVTRLNGKPMVLNALLIEKIEETPDTVITLITGKKFLVQESSDILVARATQYFRSIGLVAGTVESGETEGAKGVQE